MQCTKITLGKKTKTFRKFSKNFYLFFKKIFKIRSLTYCILMVYAIAMQMQCTWSVKERKEKKRKVKEININYACFLEIFRNFFEFFSKKILNLIFLPKISKNHRHGKNKTLKQLKKSAAYHSGRRFLRPVHRLPMTRPHTKTFFHFMSNSDSDSKIFFNFGLMY